jgi:Spy/CpxP family protein refolding chaperone
MTTRQLFAASLMLAAPLSLTSRVAHAQDAPPTAVAPSAQSTPTPGAAPAAGSRGDRPWGPRHDWDRGDRPGGEMDRDHGPGPGWDRDGGRGEEMLPFGMWWKNPEVAARIGLSAEQQKRIGDLFLQSRLQLIHLHASLQEEQLMLGPLLDATPFEESKAVAQIDKIADTRADLEKTNAKMLLDIRSVLTADQWTKLRSHGRGLHRPGERDDQGPQGPLKSN